MTFASAKVERARYTLTAKLGALGSGAGRASSETVKMVKAGPAARTRVVESGERPDADTLATLPDARDASTAASRDGFAAAPLGKPRPSRADERQFLANLARPAPELSVVVTGASKPPRPPGAARPASRPAPLETRSRCPHCVGTHHASARGRRRGPRRAPR